MLSLCSHATVLRLRMLRHPRTDSWLLRWQIQNTKQQTLKQANVNLAVSHKKEVAVQQPNLTESTLTRKVFKTLPVCNRSADYETFTGNKLLSVMDQRS